MKQFVSEMRLLWNNKPFFWCEETSFCTNEVPIPSGACVMVLGPHPDDPESVAVTCRLLMQKGGDMHYVVVTMSPSGVEDEYARRLTGSMHTSLIEKKIEIRRMEQIRAAQMFGLRMDRLTFLGLGEDEQETLLNTSKNRARIENIIQNIAPDIVIMPIGKDTNPTHAWVYRVFRQSVKGLVTDRRKPVVALYSEDPKTTRIRKDLCVLFGEASARWKGELLRIHDSQQERNINLRRMGFDERILRMNRQSYSCISESVKLKMNTPGYAEGYAEVFEIELFDYS